MSKLRLSKSFPDLTDDRNILLADNLDKDKSISTPQLNKKNEPIIKDLFMSKPVIIPCVHYLSFKEQYSQDILHGICRHIIAPKYSKGKIYKVNKAMRMLLKLSFIELTSI